MSHNVWKPTLLWETPAEHLKEVFRKTAALISSTTQAPMVKRVLYKSQWFWIQEFKSWELLDFSVDSRLVELGGRLFMVISSCFSHSSSTTSSDWPVYSATIVFFMKDGSDLNPFLSLSSTSSVRSMYASSILARSTQHFSPIPIKVSITSAPACLYLGSNFTLFWIGFDKKFERNEITEKIEYIYLWNEQLC